MMMIAPNSRERKGGKERGDVKWEYGRIWGEEEGNSDHGRGGGFLKKVANSILQIQDLILTGEEQYISWLVRVTIT